jgi:hypothetical protein
MRVEFEADTEIELLALVRRFIDGSPPEAATPRAEGDLVRETLAGIRGEHSRRAVLELAELAMRGEAMVLDDELRHRYGRPSNTAFAGIVGGPNKVARRVLGRDLITWDAAALGYRIHPSDAEIIRAAWASVAG